MRDFDEMTPEQISVALEAKIVQTIRTAKRTPQFKAYLDMLNAAYLQTVALSEILKASNRLAESQKAEIRQLKESNDSTAH